MLVTVREDVTRMLSHAQFQAAPPELPPLPSFVTTHIDPLTGENEAAARPRLSFDAFGSSLPMGALAGAAAATAELTEVDAQDLADWHREVPRNAACPCGSGKRFKNCHGAI
jgi:preprotein translocase subunit SecA